MNIFVLDNEIRACAQAHCDQHVSKMILESVQLLCTALSKKGFSTPYRPTHSGHPCVLWVEASRDNFLWLADLTVELNREFCWRYDRTEDHASISVLRQIESFAFESNGLTEFPQAMPDHYKVPGDAVAAYRRFYLAEKSAFATWTRRPAPTWWIDRAA
jgi:hypothetical protein